MSKPNGIGILSGHDGYVWMVTTPHNLNAEIFLSKEDAESYADLFLDAVVDEKRILRAQDIRELESKLRADPDGASPPDDLAKEILTTIRLRTVKDLQEDFFRVTAALNDAFDYATADGEEFTCDDYLDEALEMWVRYGPYGVIAVTAIIRNQEPVTPLRNSRYYEARKAAERMLA